MYGFHLTILPECHVLYDFIELLQVRIITWSVHDVCYLPYLLYIGCYCDKFVPAFFLSQEQGFVNASI